MSIDASFSVIPPCGFCAFGLLCFFTKFIPSTIALLFSLVILKTVPSAPFWEPAITRTVSPFLILILIAIFNLL